MGLFKIKHKILLMGALIGFLCSINLNASTTVTTTLGTYTILDPSTPCLSSVKTSMGAGASNQLGQAHAVLDALNANMLQLSTNSSGISAGSLMHQCVGALWPGGSFMLPTLQDLINAAKALIAQACGELRSKIASSLPSMMSKSFSTGIPGLPNIGFNAGMNENGGAWTINGASSTSAALSNITSSSTSTIGSTISSALPSATTTTTTSNSTSSLVNKAKGLFGD